MAEDKTIIKILVDATQGISQTKVLRAAIGRLADKIQEFDPRGGGIEGLQKSLQRMGTATERATLGFKEAKEAAIELVKGTALEKKIKLKVGVDTKELRSEIESELEKKIKLQAEFDTKKLRAEVESVIQGVKLDPRTGAATDITKLDPNKLNVQGSNLLKRAESAKEALIIEEKILLVLKEQQEAINRKAKESKEFARSDEAEKQSRSIQATADNLRATRLELFGQEGPPTLIKTVTKLKSSLGQLRNSFAAVSTEARTTKEQEDKLAETQNRLNTSLTNAVTKIIKYRIAFISMRAAIDGIKNSLKTFQEFQIEVARLEKVINPIVTDMELFERTAFSLSRQFSVTTQEVLKSFTIWAQTGLEQQDVIEATKASLLGMNAVGLDSKAVTDALTAVIFTYNTAIEESTIVLSKWIAVQAKFPINASDLANSLKVIGAAAKTVGVDIDDLAGSVAAIGAITRKSGTAIGQSLKTIFARLPKKETIKAFQDIGIGVLRTANEFRDFDDILEDLSKKWPILTDVTKANIATTIGGIRRYADFIAKMDNFAVKQQATIVSQEASTEAFRANNLELITLQKSLESAQAIVSEFSALVGGKLGKGLLLGAKLFIDFRNSFEGLFKVFAAGTAVLTSLTLSLVSIALVSKGIPFIFNSISNALRILLAGLVVSTKATIGLNAAQAAGTVTAITFSRAMRIAASSLGLFIGALSILGPLLLLFFSSNERLSSEVSDIGPSLLAQTKALKTLIQSQKDQAKVFENTIASLRKYKENLDGLTEGTEEYNKAQSSLNLVLNSIPIANKEVADSIDDIRNATGPTTESINKLEGALNNLNTTTNGTIKENEQLFKDKLLELEIQLSDKTSKKDLLTTERDKIVKLFEDNPIDLTFTKVQFTSSGVEGVTKNLKETIESIFQLDQIKFEKFGFEGAFIGTEAVFSRELAKLSDIVKKTGDKQFSTAFDTVEKRAEDAKDTFFRALEVFRKDKSKLNFAALQSAGREFFKVLDSIESRSERAFSEVTNSASREAFDLKTKVDLLRAAIADKTDGEFFLPQKLPTEFENLRKKLQDVIKESKHFPEAALDAKFFLDALKTFDEADFLSDFNKNGIKQLINFRIDANNQLFQVAKNIEDLLEIEPLFKLPKIEFESESIKDQVKAALSKEGRNPLLDILDPGDEPNLNLERIQEILRSQEKIRELINGLLDRAGNLEAKGKRIEEKRKKLLRDSFFLNTQILDVNKRNVELFNSQVLLQKLHNNLIKNQFADSEKLNKLAKERADIQFSEELLAASAILDINERQAAEVKAINRLLDTQVSIANNQLKDSFESAFDPVIEGSKALKSALTAGIGGIPDLIVSNAQKRRDLEFDIKEIELDIAEARREGDREAIFNAEQRLKNTKEELNDLKGVVSELASTFGTIFDSINAAFFKKITDDFTNALLSLTIGGKTVSQQFGEAFASVGSVFVGNLDTVLSTANLLHESALRRIFDNHTTNINNVLNGRPAFNLKPASLGSNDFRERGEALGIRDPHEVIRLNNLDTSTPGLDKDEVFLALAVQGNTKGLLKLDGTISTLSSKQQALNASITLAGSLISQSLFAGGRGSQIGSQFGGLAGGALANGALKSVFSIFGTAGGPLGTLAGGLIGGALGSIFNKKPKEPDERFVDSLDANTDAIVGNTLALKQLDKTVFNAPTRFNVPAFGGGAGFGVPVQININGNNLNSTEIANEVSSILNDQFAEGFATIGSRGF